VAIAMAYSSNRQYETVAGLSDTVRIANAHSSSTTLQQRPWSERLYATMVSLTIVPFALPFIRILITRKVQRVLLAIVVLNFPFQIQKHFFLREDAAELGSLGGLQISLTNIALLGLYVAWLIEIVLRARSSAPLRRARSKLTLPAALFLLLNVVSLVVAGDVALGTFQVWSVLVLFLLYLYVAECAASREDVLFIVRILLIGLIPQCCLMLAQAGGLVGDFQFYGIKARTEFVGDRRISGTIGSPNPAAAYLAMMMVVALGVILADVRRVDKCLAGAGLALASLSLIFTLSRGGWISFLVGIAAMMIFAWRRVPWKTVGAVVAVPVLLAIPFRGVIAERLNSDDNGSAAARMPLNELAAAMIADHPLLGVGANNFPLAMQPYLRQSFSGEFLYTVHNTYLLVCAETGIGGLIAFVWFLFAIVRQGSRCWRMRNPLFAPIALGCAAAVMGFMVQMNFDPFGSGAAVDLLWLFAGLTTAMVRMNASPAVVPQPDLMANRGVLFKLRHSQTENI
jgi:putative inorganic carbon (hco3(-)) transporter